MTDEFVKPLAPKYSSIDLSQWGCGAFKHTRLHETSSLTYSRSFLSSASLAERERERGAAGGHAIARKRAVGTGCWTDSLPSGRSAAMRAIPSLIVHCCTTQAPPAQTAVMAHERTAGVKLTGVQSLRRGRLAPLLVASRSLLNFWTCR